MLGDQLDVRGLSFSYTRPPARSPSYDIALRTFLKKYKTNYDFYKYTYTCSIANYTYQNLYLGKRTHDKTSPEWAPRNFLSSCRRFFPVANGLFAFGPY